MTSLIRRCHPERSEAQSRDPADLRDRFPATGSSTSLGMTGIAYFFINSSTAAVIPIIPVRIVGSGTGANLLECRVGNSFPAFLNSAIFAGIDCAEVKINRRNGMVRQAVFGKIFAAHRRIDDLHIFIA